jgi:ABC-type dipeptide/oligopeptide/nickel transport system ATPase component
MAPLLDVKDLHVEFMTRDGVVKAVNGITFALERGKVLTILGESGSGKSVTLRSLVRLLPKVRTRIQQTPRRSIMAKDLSLVISGPISC